MTEVAAAGIFQERLDRSPFPTTKTEPASPPLSEVEDERVNVGTEVRDLSRMKVEEVGHPDLPRLRYLNEEHVAAPSYARRERVDLFP